MVKIMASKLTSSLRKSISAEQENVEKKQVGVKKTPVKKPVVARISKSPANTSTATKETPVAIAAAKAVNKPEESVSTAKDSAKTNQKVQNKPVDLMENFKELAGSFSGKFDLANVNQYFQGWELVQNAIEKITATNHEVLSSCLDNLVEVNDEISDYVKKVLEAKDANDIYQLNNDFISIMQKKQQELISKNLAVFNHFTAWKI